MSFYFFAATPWKCGEWRHTGQESCPSRSWCRANNVWRVIRFCRLAAL